MTRITNEHRSRILKAVLQHRFGAAFASLQAEYAQLAQDIYEDVYDAKQRAQMEALPDGWLPRSISIRSKLGESYADLPFNGWIRHINSSDLVEAKERSQSRVILSRDINAVMEIYDHNHNFAEIYSALQVKAADLRNQVREAEKLTMAILERATTLPKLLAVWPEVKPFVEFLQEAKPKLPALPIDQVNGLLDLPVDKAA